MMSCFPNFTWFIKEMSLSGHDSEVGGAKALLQSFYEIKKNILLRNARVCG